MATRHLGVQRTFVAANHVEESQQRVNFGAVGMRDHAPIELIAVRAE
jgi:hypothetical protein